MLDGTIVYNDNVEGVTITTNNFVFNGSVLKCGKLVIINLYGFFTGSLTVGSTFMSSLPIPKSRIVTNINSKELILDTNGNISVQNEVTVEWIEGEIVYLTN